MQRRIIKIDRDKCNGCGLCVPACHEGALQIINGKAELVKDSFCDGLGDCLGECPQNAISFEYREAEAYDDEAVAARLRQRVEEKTNHPAPPPSLKPNGGCPGMRAFSFDDDKHSETAKSRAVAEPPTASELRQWPVQLKLVPVNAPYWEQADMLVAADCVPTAYADFHKDLLRGKRLVIACPKLDDSSNYVAKLAAILTENEINSVTVAIMEVPCCGGLSRIVREAIKASGKDIPLATYVAGIEGNIDKRG